MFGCPNFRRFERCFGRSDRTFGSGAVDVKPFCHWLQWGANLASHRKSGGLWRHKNGMIRCPNFRWFKRRVDGSDRMFSSGAVDLKRFCHWLQWGANLASNRKSGGRWRNKNGMVRCPNFRRFEGRIGRSDRTFGSGAVGVKRFCH